MERAAPAMEVGLTDHVLNVKELFLLLQESQAAKRDPFEKRAIGK